MFRCLAFCYARFGSQSEDIEKLKAHAWTHNHFRHFCYGRIRSQATLWSMLVTGSFVDSLGIKCGEMWRSGFDSPLVPFESSHPAVSPKLCSTYRLAEFGMAWQSRFINLVQCGKHMSFTTLVSPVALWTWWAWQQWWAGAGRRYFFGDPGFTGYIYCNTSCLSFWGSLYDLTAASH